MNKKISFLIFVTLSLTLGHLIYNRLSNLAKRNYEANCLRVNLQSEPPSLDWSQASDSTSFDVICNIMCGLTKFNDKMETVPCCAQSWQISDDGLSITFYLNKKITWSDKKPLTAHDFVFAFRHLLNPATASSYAYFLYDITGAEKINTGQETDISKLGVKALDDYTLKISLNKPCPYFLSLMAFCPTYPMRQDLIKKYGNDWCNPGNLVTNGPFTLDTWEHEYKIILKANDNYFEGRPKLDTIKMFMIPEQSLAYSLYLNNQLDYIDNRSLSTTDIAASKNLPSYHNYPLLRINYLGFNTKKWPMNIPQIRKAISLAINRQVFPQILLRQELPSCVYLPQALSILPLESKPCYDVKLAKQLFNEAKQPIPEIDLLYPNRQDAKLACEAIQDALKSNLGIKVNLIAKEWKVYLYELKNNPPHLFRASWGADYYDPQTFMDVFESASGNNYTNWGSKKYDDIVSKASQELDKDKRAKLYKQALNILDDECPISPLYFATQNILAKPWVHNLAFNALDLQFFKNVYIK